MPITSPYSGAGPVHLTRHMPSNGTASSPSRSEVSFSQNVARFSPREPVWLDGSAHTTPVALAVRGATRNMPSSAPPAE